MSQISLERPEQGELVDWGERTTVKFTHSHNLFFFPLFFILFFIKRLDTPRGVSVTTTARNSMAQISPEGPEQGELVHWGERTTR